MITRKGFFYLLCLAGYLVIILNFIPVMPDGNIRHIRLFPTGYSGDVLQQYIDYRRLTLYFFIWSAFCFLLYKIVTEIRVSRQLRAMFGGHEPNNNR